MDETFLVKPADKPSDRVAIAFSSLNANGFSFYNMFEKYSDSLHRIYIRDPYDQWYDRGISETVTDWTGVSQLVQKAVADLGASQSLTFGASMGGYAAIRMAREMDASACLAMSPQTLLDRRLPHTPREPVSDANRDLAMMLGSWRPSNATVFFGAADFVDIYNVLRVPWQGANLLPVADQDHLVSQFLLTKKIMLSLVQSFAETGTVPARARLEMRGVSLDTRCFDTVQSALITRVVEGYYLDAPWDVLTQLNALKALGSWADGYQIEGRIRSKLGEHDAAVAAAKEAVRLAPKSVTISDAFADILDRAGQTDAAISAYRRSLSLRKKHYGALCRLGELLWTSGETDEALDMLRQAVEIRPRLERAFTIASRLGIDRTRFTAAST
ncbi:tetratricopeptide repeat protein [Poseidonocella sedimentorum]|uniref:Tetratricopeptide repeat-containing protein n=1 Tax=Poseidonocella sedimentorum TaxID=871652 RepID=A0A1I6ED98_9RHOB|nr:tetratricopeptide repeat protein [Poseidonocella sedimentorum]SFR15637.1 Tetratricopeptide repeat-containing protein [Poseidonocella sedimentorum]